MPIHRKFPTGGQRVVGSRSRANILTVNFQSPFLSLQSGELEPYLAEIQRRPAPSVEEMEGWHRRAVEGDGLAREQIVLAHLTLVVRIAFQYAGYGLPMADLVSEGNLGLMRAAELFDPCHGVAFSTYAGVWIKQRMHRAITAQARVVRIPVWRSQRLRKLDRLHEDLNAELGRDAELVDLADRLGVSEEQVGRMTSDRLSIGTLDEVPEAALLTQDLLPEQHLSREELRDEIAACLHGLDDTELQIVARKFGLLEEEPESYRKMAPRFGRSREWIRRVGEEAVAKLRSSLASVGDLPRTLVRARRKKTAKRLLEMSAKTAAPAKMSVFQMALIQWLEPLIAIL